MGGLAHKAEVYPRQFCEAIIRGIRRQIQADGGWHLYSEEEQSLIEVWAEEEEEELDEIQDIAEEGAEVIGEGKEEHEIADDQKRALGKLHRGLGHPALPDFIRFMKAARVKGEVVKWAHRHFRCEICESRPKPKAVRVGSIPKTYQPNKVLGIDLIYIPEVGGKNLLPALSVLDWGSNFQVVELLANKDPEKVWQAMWSCWMRIFGCPEIIICDSGKEFLADFVRKATGHGIVVFQAGARAPWQNGKTERHGAHFKELLEKARNETVLADEAELRLLMQEVESCKNRYANRSGFSPVQRQVRQWPRSPSELLSDEAIDPLLVSGAMVDDVERLHEMRRLAQKAFIEHNARSTLKNVSRARSKITTTYQPGDYVYVYRVHRQRKRKDGGPQERDNPRNRPTWVGPGTVVTVDGANLWVTIWGELWKVAREQCKLATNMEKTGIELVLSECKDVIEEYKKNSRKAGYKDLTEEPWPEEIEDEEKEERGDQEAFRRVRFAGDQQQEDMSYEPSLAETEDEQPAEQRRMSIQTVDEPERERTEESRTSEQTEERPTASTSSEEAAPSMGDLDPVVPDPRPTAEQAQAPGFQEQVDRSRQMSNRLDGLPPPSTPIRGWRLRREESNPYCWEMYFNSEEDQADEEIEEARRRANSLLKKIGKSNRGEYWQVDIERGRLVRHHVKKRRTPFHPKEGCPVDLDAIQTKRRTELNYKENLPTETEEDDWTKKVGPEKHKGWWKGTTTFFFKAEASQEEKEAVRVLLTERKRSDEVDMRKESQKDLEEWKDFDAAEWQKIVDSGAVRVLSPEESRAVKVQLAREGKLKRILPTKIARRYKPSEQPGTPATKKSRLCLRGDLDPDILDLEKFSPTVNTMNLAVMMQIGANRRMVGEIADFKNAFCQSQPLERKGGPLYFKQQPEGIKGVDPECIAIIIAGCYGLTDAPLHWRKSLTDFLKSINYEQSTMDPCIYKLYQGNEIAGMIAIEVDDLLMIGNEYHQGQLQKLKERFTFGKWVTLPETEEGAMFNGRRIRQKRDGEFQIDMMKFVEERLHEVELEKGRSSKKKEEVNEVERQKMRAACGSLNWLAKEGRPDLAGPASLLSSRIAHARIEDITALNDVIRSVKKVPDMSIRLQPLVNMKFSVVTDASFGNDGYHSQGGQMILCHEDGLQKNLCVITNVLCWHSGRIQRVVNSTLAAETQSLSRGLGDLLWVMVLFEELQDRSFEIRNWTEHLSGSKVMALASSSSSERLKGSLAVVDAKSLYDQFSRETIGGSDKRTAIEIQIIREDLNSLHGSIRWIDHPAMLADGLTKVKGSNRPLYQVLCSGKFQLTAEEDHMQARHLARENGQKSHEIRRFGINQNDGSCDILRSDDAVLIPNMPHAMLEFL